MAATWGGLFARWLGGGREPEPGAVASRVQLAAAPEPTASDAPSVGAEAAPAADPAPVPAEPAPPFRFFFCVPLKPRVRSKDWDLTVRLLGETLRSILAQSDPGFEVIVAGHDRPDLPELDDPRVTWVKAAIQVPENGAEGKKDQIRKMHIMGGHVRRRGGGYIMVVDSDDLIHHDIVRFVREHPHPNGYIIRAGYVLDMAMGQMGKFPRWTDWTQLQDECGTCAILRFDPADLPVLLKKRMDVNRARPLYRKLTGHRRWESVMMQEERYLATLPFRGTVYRMNTGVNATSEYRRSASFTNSLVRNAHLFPVDLEVKRRLFDGDGPVEPFPVREVPDADGSAPTPPAPPPAPA